MREEREWHDRSRDSLKQAVRVMWKVRTLTWMETLKRIILELYFVSWDKKKKDANPAINLANISTLANSHVIGQIPN